MQCRVTNAGSCDSHQHLRFIGCALTWARPCGLRSGDRYYVTLPLYHGYC